MPRRAASLLRLLGTCQVGSKIGTSGRGGRRPLATRGQGEGLRCTSRRTVVALRASWCVCVASCGALPGGLDTPSGARATVSGVASTRRQATAAGGKRSARRRAAVSVPVPVESTNTLESPIYISEKQRIESESSKDLTIARDRAYREALKSEGSQYEITDEPSVARHSHTSNKPKIVRRSGSNPIGSIFCVLCNHQTSNVSASYVQLDLGTMFIDRETPDGIKVIPSHNLIKGFCCEACLPRFTNLSNPRFETITKRDGSTVTIENLNKIIHGPISEHRDSEIFISRPSIPDTTPIDPRIVNSMMYRDGQSKRSTEIVSQGTYKERRYETPCSDDRNEIRNRPRQVAVWIDRNRKG